MDDVVDATGPAGHEQVRLGDVLADIVAQTRAMGIDLSGAGASTTSVGGDFPIAGHIQLFEVVYGVNGCGAIRATAVDATAGVRGDAELVDTGVGMIESGLTKLGSSSAIAFASEPNVGVIDQVVYSDMNVALVGEVGHSVCVHYTFYGFSLLSFHTVQGLGVFTNDAEKGVLPAPI